jgi:adenylyltransferase/sulfurtransferase
VLVIARRPPVPVALYLAAAGGWIGLVDYDVVDFSSLRRQVIHGTSGLGR